MTSNREQYIAAAKQLEGKLLSKLRPQWRARDEAKERMGVERWRSNENPKNDFAQLRIEYEQELKDIRKAIQYLQSAELDTSVIEMESKLLHEKIQMGQDGPIESLPTISALPHGSSSGILAQDQPQEQHQPHLSMSQPEQQHVQHEPQRYNGMRPTDLSRRVDSQLYPDPTLFGWMFTGSYGVTEFFEIRGSDGEIIKLDWYYTTGTIKTSMNHPVQGYTQLFGARVDPDTYRAILQDPRSHTGQRYQQRRHRNHHRSRH
jgi:hypothetical protein